MKTLIFLGAAALAVPGASGAQEPPAHWFVGAALGAGPHPDRAGDVFYGTSTSNTGQISAAHRFGNGSLRPTLRVEMLSEGPGSDWDDCPLAPNGSCERDFPAPDGLGVAAGVAYQPTARIDAIALAGAGRYDGTMRWFLETEGALRIARQFAFTISLRQMMWTEPGLGGHWYRPVHLGMRRQW
ncbi:MAG TPA: hypothetical protein VEB19_09145 [Gemmatimonadaceae bacterium]|nr:hypothetical protein [Gemmatimonadaceae bacterium]